VFDITPSQQKSQPIHWAKVFRERQILLASTGDGTPRDVWILLVNAFSLVLVFSSQFFCFVKEPNNIVKSVVSLLRVVAGHCTMRFWKMQLKLF